MKKILAIIMAAVIAVMCTACGGLGISKVKGNWTLSTINGQPYAEYAASMGADASIYAMNWTVNDKSLVSTSVNGTSTIDINVKSNGFEMTVAGTVFGVIYDEKADTFSYSAKVGDVQYDYVLVRGTSEVGSITAPAEDNASADGSDYAEDNYGEE